MSSVVTSPEKGNDSSCTGSNADLRNTMRYIDSHCHIDLVASGSTGGSGGGKGTPDNSAPAPPSDSTASSQSPWELFLKKTPMPPEYVGCIAIFCFTDEPSWSRWGDYLTEDPSASSSVWAAIGIHPHDAKNFTPAVRALITETMRHPKVVAWGECGLDYFRLISTKEEQQAAFLEQVQCAIACNKPLVVHCRDQEGSTAATTDCYAILKQWMPSDWRVHFHCWSQTAAETEEAMRLFPNAYFGFTGLVTTNRSGVRDAVGVVPLDRILLETDGPFCAPSVKGKRPRVAHPGHIPVIAQWLADHKKVPVESLYEHALQNTAEMYGLNL